MLYRGSSFACLYAARTVSDACLMATVLIFWYVTTIRYAPTRFTGHSLSLSSFLPSLGLIYIVSLPTHGGKVAVLFTCSTFAHSSSPSFLPGVGNMVRLPHQSLSAIWAILSLVFFRDGIIPIPMIFGKFATAFALRVHPTLLFHFHWYLLCYCFFALLRCADSDIFIQSLFCSDIGDLQRPYHARCTSCSVVLLYLFQCRYSRVQCFVVIPHPCRGFCPVCGKVFTLELFNRFLLVPSLSPFGAFSRGTYSRAT